LNSPLFSAPWLSAEIALFTNPCVISLLSVLLSVTILAKILHWFQLAREKKNWFVFKTTTASLNELVDQNWNLFFSKPQWDRKVFGDEKGVAGTLALWTLLSPGSLGKTWEEQQEFLSDKEGEFVPSARDLVEGIIAYYRKNHKRPFSGYSLRSSSVTTRGYRVWVGIDSGGIQLGSSWEDERGSLLGVAVGRHVA